MNLSKCRSFKDIVVKKRNLKKYFAFRGREERRVGGREERERWKFNK